MSNLNEQVNLVPDFKSSLRRRRWSLISQFNMRLKTGIAILLLFILLGFVLPIFSPYDPQSWNTLPSNLTPSWEHLLGTTDLGQDTFWLLAQAVHNSIIVGLIVAFFATVIGVIVGLLAGFRGGFTDRILTLFIDAFIVIPALPILILMSSMLKGRASIFMVAAVLVVFNWSWPARQTRSMALSMREREFINTAWFSGEGTLKIITKEILPYITGWAMANFINTMLVAIATESGLAVIGLSSSTSATLGTMLYWALQHQAILGSKWWWIGSPTITIMLLFISLFLLLTGVSQYSSVKRGR